MSDAIHEGPTRPRTVSRLRFVAPPGMALEETDRKTIGRYEIIKTLGRGAMGVVYKARDPLLDRIVAVKTIVSPQGVGKRVRSAYLERFEREAKAAAKMQHPAIVTIFDVGVDEDLGAPFMVLEYLPGESLADRLDRVRMPLARAVQIALDLASALAFAHRQRIVHRDVKPANVLHAGEGRWKLADFGIARLPDSDLTQVGIFMGTPGYSPPEAIREGRYTPQADVFAWGAVLYELLSGHIPYEGPDTRTTNSHVVKGEASPPTKYDASIPAPLSAVVMTALNPSATDRYRDAADAEASLRKAWDHCLTNSLVSPASLTGEELPHERVGGEMHSRFTNPPAQDSGVFDASATVRDARPPQMPPPSPSPSSGAAAVPGGLVIEARKAERGADRVTDDDPTRLLVRDRESSQPGDRTVDMRTAGKASALPEGQRKGGKGRSQIDGTPVVARAPRPGEAAAVTASGTAPPRWVWVMVVVAALAVGGTVAWLILSAL